MKEHSSQHIQAIMASRSVAATASRTASLLRHVHGMGEYAQLPCEITILRLGKSAATRDCPDR